MAAGGFSLGAPLACNLALGKLQQLGAESTGDAALQVLEREREIASIKAAHKAALALLEEQLLNAESRLARESEQGRSLEHR